MVWEKPFYPFRIPAGRDKNGQQLLKEVWIDVTLSAPPFATPKDTLSRVLKDILGKFPNIHEIKVLDLGAGKLRNTLFLLEMDCKEVVAVDYAQQRTTKYGMAMYGRAQKYPGFKSYEFPGEFIKLKKKKFDLILLINVVNIMPVPVERLFLLTQCFDRLKKNGLLLWYTQTADYYVVKACTDDNVLGDGWYLKKNQKYKTFYKQYRAGEIDEMLLSCGLEFQTHFDIDKIQARLYKKLQSSLMKKVLTSKLIESSGIVDIKMPEPQSENSRIVIQNESNGEEPGYKAYIPNPRTLCIENLYISCLKKIRDLPEDTYDYETLIALIMQYVFKKDLLNLEFYKDEKDKTKRDVFKMTNSAKEGFFADIPKKHKLISKKVKKIVFECKNNKEDINNSEIDRLLEKLEKSLGGVGFLVCRAIQDRNRVLGRFKGAYPEKLVIVLDDDDIMQVLNYRKVENNKGIMDWLDSKAKLVSEID
jgi:hypothetical protein